MKSKLNIIFATLALMAALVMVFAVTAFAEETESITVTYNWYSGSVWETASPNEDGSYTLRSSKKSGDGTVTLSDGSVVNKEFYGWFDEEGNMYAPGATVTFTKSTRLYEAYGVTVYNADDLKARNGWQDNTFVRLGADITLDTNLSTEWCTRTIDLNGHNITSTANKHAIYVKRGACIIIGQGKFIHQPATVNTSADIGFLHYDAHGYADESNPQMCWIGRGVEIETPYNLLYVNGTQRDKHPNIVIAGKVSARTVARINPAIVEARCYIASGAEVNVSTALLEFKNTTGTSKYMTVTLDGTINVANGTASVFTDFTLEKVDFVVNGGKFCITETDNENIGYYLSDAHMLKETTEGDLTWYEIVPSDCAHSWSKNEAESVAPTTTQLGKDVFDCLLCKRQKTVITVYDPSDSEITITVMDENGVTNDVKVKTGDVLELAITGVGENTSFTFVGVKGSEEYPASSIVAVEIPFGVSLISATASNEVLATISIADGVDVSVTKLDGLTALKTINIGAATVQFASTGTNTSLETINSNVAGATVTFVKSCFDKKSNIKYLTMSNGSSYSFGENSFRLTGIETLIFPDEATISFAGGAAFYNAAVKYAYFGKSITSINNKPLDCANNLEHVVINGATYIDQYCFCVAGSNNATSRLRVYCHSENISINNNAFINRQNYGVEFYTIDPDIKSLNCNYTVYCGIPHKYVEGIVKEPTCVETGIMGYVTDCVCGVNEVATYTVYTADGSQEYSTSQSEIPLSDTHIMGTKLANINYKDGYLSTGTKEYYCSLCEKATVEEKEPSANALFTNKGYSVCTYDGKNAMTQGYSINKTAVEAYKALKPSFTYSLVVAANASGEAINPVSIENGKAVANVSNAYICKFDVNVNNYIDVIVTGITDSIIDKHIVFCMYVYDGETIQYIDNGQALDSVVGCCYSALTSTEA